MATAKADRTMRTRYATRGCAIAGALTVAFAGMAAPWYVRSDLVAPVALSLLIVAVLIVAVLLWALRDEDVKPAVVLPASASHARTLEFAPEELRRQLDTLRHTQGELLVAKQAAEAAMMAKGEFLATMSHEIRTPLNGVLPLLELVLSTKLAPDQREYLATAYASARELLRIVDAILDYSKLDAERLELETTGLNLRELVDSVAQLMQRNAEAKNLRLTVTIDPNVRLAVRGDPVRLRQVLMNLVSNAVKFTERGGVQIQVSKRMETRDHHEIVFAVRDTGIGIAADTAAKLFRPFSQADASTTRVFGGTGLGLAISKRLVDLMQGRIGVKSEPGKGSLFWFSVPLLKAVGDVQVRRDLDGLRALALVDDEIVSRRVQTFGSTLGIEITPVRQPADALAGLRTSANMGERWRHALLLIDAAPFRAACPALVRNLLKDASLGHVRVFLFHGADVTDLAPDPRVRMLAGPFAEDTVRGALEQMFGVQEPRFAHADGPPAALLEFGPDEAQSTTLQGRVLLVEDNPVNRRVAQRLLNLHGLDVTAVSDGREAIERLEREPYDAVLMDCLMPIMDGYTATRTWRARERATGEAHLPILAMTANAMAGDRERCLASGMDDYISKPLDRAALLQMLRRWLPPMQAMAPDATDTMAQAEISRASGPAPFDRHAESERETPATSASHALDASIIRDLLDTMGDEFGDLVRVYLEDAPQRLQELEIAAVTNDALAQISPAHTLKSSSANVGATALSEFARRIEHAARSGIATAPAEVASGIRREYDRVAGELSALLERGAA
jgi:signal transduction histidine kinase/CheY-like chemotaxis protein/HPt (histidine-containing phosphotransfer) domain-containing protein